MKEIQDGYLYPFIQLQVEIQMSIFHPFCYPEYIPPSEDDNSKNEESDFTGTNTNYRSSYKSTTKKSRQSYKTSVTPDERDTFKSNNIQPEIEAFNPDNVPVTEEKKENNKPRKSVSFMDQPSLIVPKSEKSSYIEG